MSSPDVHVPECSASSSPAAARQGQSIAKWTADAAPASPDGMRASQERQQSAAVSCSATNLGTQLRTAPSQQQADEAAGLSLAAAAAALAHDPAVLHTAASLVPADMVVGDDEALWAAADAGTAPSRWRGWEGQGLTQLAPASAGIERGASHNAASSSPRAQTSFLQAAASIVPRMLSMLPSSPLSKARTRSVPHPAAAAAALDGTVSPAAGSCDGAAAAAPEEDAAKLDALVHAAAADEDAEHTEPAPTVIPLQQASDSSALGSTASSSSPQVTPGACSEAVSTESSGSFFGSDSVQIAAVPDRRALAADAAWFGSFKGEAGVRFADDVAELSSNRGSHGHRAQVRRRWGAAAAAGKRLSPPRGVSKGAGRGAAQKEAKLGRKRCAAAI